MNKYATVGQWCEKCNHVFCLSPDKHGQIKSHPIDFTSDERIEKLEATIAQLREEVEKLKQPVLLQGEPLRMYCNCGVSNVSMINRKYICQTCNKERKF